MCEVVSRLFSASFSIDWTHFLSLLTSGRCPRPLLIQWPRAAAPCGSPCFQRVLDRDKACYVGREFARTRFSGTNVLLPRSCISSVEVNNCCKNIPVVTAIVRRDKGEAATRGRVKDRVNTEISVSVLHLRFSEGIFSPVLRSMGHGAVCCEVRVLSRWLCCSGLEANRVFSAAFPTGKPARPFFLVSPRAGWVFVSTHLSYHIVWLVDKGQCLSNAQTKQT